MSDRDEIAKLENAAHAILSSVDEEIIFFEEEKQKREKKKRCESELARVAKDFVDELCARSQVSVVEIKLVIDGSDPAKARRISTSSSNCYEKGLFIQSKGSEDTYEAFNPADSEHIRAVIDIIKGKPETALN